MSIPKVIQSLALVMESYIEASMPPLKQTPLRRPQLPEPAPPPDDVVDVGVSPDPADESPLEPKPVFCVEGCPLPVPLDPELPLVAGDEVAAADAEELLEELLELPPEPTGVNWSPVLMVRLFLTPLPFWAIFEPNVVDPMTLGAFLTPMVARLVPFLPTQRAETERVKTRDNSTQRMMMVLRRKHK